MSITPEREKAVSFTNPYYSNKLQFVGPKAHPFEPTAAAMKGMTVGAQRATELRWPITAVDRARFAVRRKGEALRALERLGVGKQATRFLGFPDQGTTGLLVHANEVAQHALDGVLRAWQPTVVVGPSLLDLHPDHSALAVMLSLALEELPRALAPRCHIRFLIHNPRLLARHEESLLRFLAPHKDLQEREVSGVYFLGRAGYDLLGRLFDHTRVNSSDHQVLVY